MSEQPSASPSRGVQLAEITNGLVRLHHEYYGKGPTKAKTYAVNDTILCILHGGFTTVEQTLMASAAPLWPGRGALLHRWLRAAQTWPYTRPTKSRRACCGHDHPGAPTEGD